MISRLKQNCTWITHWSVFSRLLIKNTRENPSCCCYAMAKWHLLAKVAMIVDIIELAERLVGQAQGNMKRQNSWQVLEKKGRVSCI